MDGQIKGLRILLWFQFISLIIYINYNNYKVYESREKIFKTQNELDSLQNELIFLTIKLNQNKDE
jgi:hypothetical protein